MKDYFNNDVTPGLYIKGKRNGDSSEILFSFVLGFTPKGNARLLNFRWYAHWSSGMTWRVNKASTNNTNEMIRLESLDSIKIPVDGIRELVSQWPNEVPLFEGLK
ncbi:MAG: hypothetical protein ACP5N7_07365 [Candidatus Pacearchaeota archaeon]